MDFHGEYVTAADVTFRPAPVQRPHPPVRIGCNWPNRRPLDRAARWDGVAPMMVSPDDGSWNPTPEAVAELVAEIGERRGGTGPFDVVITGRTDAERPGAARETVGSLAGTGATWWLEGVRWPAPRPRPPGGIRARCSPLPASYRRVRAVVALGRQPRRPRGHRVRRAILLHGDVHP